MMGKRESKAALAERADAADQERWLLAKVMSDLLDGVEPDATTAAKDGANTYTFRLYRASECAGGIVVRTFHSPVNRRDSHSVELADRACGPDAIAYWFRVQHPAIAGALIKLDQARQEILRADLDRENRSAQHWADFHEELSEA